ncbi:hypothetical protein PTTG_26011 [Puccinia triticina 1-1 BBBD Race 1]|uniref:Uncharacterized protein n=1 Tax=Puccinia triticina (isolate 1-1 / race 1 (BBBD)) TaxID=630390 RepID=A0A180GYK5_PUCT1|nr:hypothetical protein PTTG_26011 [Puccinia triticina 1-1 BBBD Race 1]
MSMVSLFSYWVLVGVQVAEEASIRYVSRPYNIQVPFDCHRANRRSFGIPLALASLQAKKENSICMLVGTLKTGDVESRYRGVCSARIGCHLVLIAAARSEYLRSSASSNDSVEIPSSPLSPLSSPSSSDSLPSESSPSPQYSLPDYEEEAPENIDNESPRSECTLERQIFGGNSPVYLPIMAANKGSVGSNEGTPLSHMIYLLGNESGVEDTDEEMSEDRGRRHSGHTRCAKDAILS